MPPSKRPSLPPTEGCQNAGLALERYLEEQGAPVKAIDLLEVVCGIGADEAYRIAFNRWQALTAPSGEPMVHICLELTSSLAIGLGGESALEVGFTTHRTYGMPLIPGSALKGLCRRVAEKAQAQPNLVRTVFGKSDGDKNNILDVAGYVTFHDAWYVPSSEGGKPYHRDVITVHHPDYYKDGSEWPTDFDDPTPVPFLIVKKGSRFLFTLDGPPDWAGYAKEMLIWGLVNMGIGAKTNAGYGYFAMPEEDNRPNGMNAHEIHWRDAQVTYTPGNGELRAGIPGAPGSAIANRASRDACLLPLPPETRDQLLTTRRLFPVTVVVEPLGNGFRIIRIEIP